ncbi:unnamed protein product [Miscanthus lutarioriparius]|uniref:Xylanase inhibitor N-terminal domain-containing protein n=1 Tax=Miscanthus lutarioriparius TaxID=422564 RepID=A0A811MP82_9POAL|nr:unnamed protein product [Miscanthus lutarioriparius]
MSVYMASFVVIMLLFLIIAIQAASPWGVALLPPPARAETKEATGTCPPYKCEISILKIQINFENLILLPHLKFKTCRYDYQYVSVETFGVLAYEAFTFGEKDQQVSLSLGFGCGALTDGNLLGTSGILGMGYVDGVAAGWEPTFHSPTARNASTSQTSGSESGAGRKHETVQEATARRPGTATAATATATVNASPPTSTSLFCGKAVQRLVNFVGGEIRPPVAGGREIRLVVVDVEGDGFQLEPRAPVMQHPAEAPGADTAEQRLARGLFETQLGQFLGSDVLVGRATCRGCSDPR